MFRTVVLCFVVHGRPIMTRPCQGPGDVTRDKTLWLIFFYLKLMCRKYCETRHTHKTYSRRQQQQQPANNKQAKKQLIALARQNERQFFPLALLLYKREQKQQKKWFSYLPFASTFIIYGLLRVVIANGWTQHGELKQWIMKYDMARRECVYLLSSFLCQPLILSFSFFPFIDASILYRVFVAGWCFEFRHLI